MLNRRSFIKKAAGAAVGAIGFPYVVRSSAVGAAGTVLPSNRIVMGCIGMGGQGISDMREFLGAGQVQVVAVCDVDTKHRNNARDIVNRKYGSRDCAAYGDFRELLARDDIEAVMIAAPDHWHAIIGVMAARAGKDVHAQKPLAYTIAEGRAICDAVKQYGVVWQTGSQQRSERNFRHACELVRNGRIGEVRTVRVGLCYGNTVIRGYAGHPPNATVRQLTQPAAVPEGFDYEMWLGPAPKVPYSPGRCHGNFRWISDYSGGQITDWSGHHCDIAQWGMGTELTSPVEIEGKGVWPRVEDGLYDTVESYRFVCRYAEGFSMIVSDAQQFPEGRDGVLFTKGWQWNMGVLFEGSEGWVHVNRGGISARPKSLLTSVIGPDEIHLYKSDDHKENFLDCVRSRSQPIAPAEVGHRSIMIGHLGLIAIKMGRKLRWDPVDERFINDSEADRLLSRPMRSPWHL